MFGRERHGMLGLDIGSSAIKLVELSLHNQGYRIDACAVEPMPPSAVQDKGIHDVSAVADAIRRVVHASGSKQRRVVAAVGGGTAMTKVITMPAGLSELEMEEQIALEASQSISYPLDEVNLDFEILRPTAGGERTEVLLAASRTDQVDNYAMAVEMAGLELRILDIEAYALENAYPVYSAQLPEQGKGKSIAVVDIGHNVTTVNVLQDGEGVYQQSQSFGCNQMLEALRSDGGDTAEDGQHLLRLTAEQRESVVLPFRDSAVRHIHRVVQLFQSSPQSAPLDHILLSGGGALLPDLAAGVRNQTGVSAEPFSLLRPLELAPHLNRSGLLRLAPTLLVALGLGIRGVSP